MIEMQRKTYISIAKFIGVLLMVFGHVGCALPYARDIIYAFHMPLFLILSGMCFKDEYILNGFNFVKRKIIGVYWPYLKWSLLFLLLHNVFYHMHLYDACYGLAGVGSSLYTMNDFLSHGIHIVTLMYGHEQLLGTFWFMRELFLGSLLFYLLLRITRQRALFTIGILLVLSVGMKIALPHLSIAYSTPYSAAFISLGYAINKAMTKIHEGALQWKTLYDILLCIVGGIVLVIGALFIINPEGMLYQSEYTMMPYLLTALTGSYLCIRFSLWAANRMPDNAWRRFLVFIGDHTFEVMTLHFLSFKLISLAIIAIYSLPIEQLAEFPVILSYAQQGWWIAYLFIGISIPIGYAYVREQIVRVCSR